MTTKWWKESVVYQIYPRSFQDSDGDGIGDLRGIIGRLDYLKELGVDVVWLSPVYKSPNDDNGYDISDYQDIMDEFGTLADWEELLAEMHARGIRMVMDLVVNHSSDEHPWFVESRKSKDNPYRDFYIWRPAKDGREPNNWESFFSGSAWQYDEATDEYYLHLFSKKQPDLNWENPALRQKIYEMMRWWLDKGIDGFRMDVITMLSKTPGLPDAPVVGDKPYHWGGQYFIHGPRLMEYLSEMNREVLSRGDILTVGEAVMATTEHAIDLTNEETGHLNMLFQFEHMDLDRDPGSMSAKWALKRWDLLDLKRVMTRWQRDLEGKGWNSLYLSNHDQPRSVSRFGDDGYYRVQSAKLLATFLHMLQGTPYVYQGEEIGMTNVRFPSIDDYRDIETLNMYREFVHDRGIDPAHRHGRHPRQEPRQRPDADAVGRQPQRRLHDRHALDRRQPELPADQRRRGAGRPRLGLPLLQEADPAAEGEPGHRPWPLRPAAGGPWGNLRLHPHPWRRPPAGDPELHRQPAGLRPALRHHVFGHGPDDRQLRGRCGRRHRVADAAAL